jgi:aspartyl-tRNA(Asn)/glutamyl-tRNA(Gln) amidotransferase subunit C
VNAALLAARIMSVSNEQVRHIARLARIAMSDEEIERLVPELNNILGWVEQLGEVNTDGVEPLTAVIEQKLRLRDDVVNDGNIRDEVLANAPDAQHGFFAVPKVIE